jgi:hypothetical protein
MIDDELVEEACRVYCWSAMMCTVGNCVRAGRCSTKQSLAFAHYLKPAIEAILPAIRAATIEECAKELDAASATYREARERLGLTAESAKLVLTCEQTADVCAAKVRSLTEKETEKPAGL